MKLSAQSKIGVGVLAAIMVIGFCAYVFQLTQGDKLTVQVYGETVELTDEPISVQRQ